MTAADHLHPAQFFHGTTAALAPGDVIDPKQPHAKVHNVSTSDSVYFTSDPAKASFYADRAASKLGGDRRVYQVEPTGNHWQDMQTRHSPENRVTKQPIRVLAEHPYVDWQRTHYER